MLRACSRSYRHQALSERLRARFDWVAMVQEEVLVAAGTGLRLTGGRRLASLGALAITSIASWRWYVGLECRVEIVVSAGTQRMLHFGTRSMLGPVVLHGACSMVARLALARLEVVMALLSVRSTELALLGLAASVAEGSLATPRSHSTTSPGSSARVPLLPMRARSPFRRAASSSSAVC